MDLVYDEKLDDYICCVGPIPWSVRSVEPREDFTMLVGFADDTMREFDFKPLLCQEIFGTLSDIGRFMKARVGHGTVVWEGDIDIAPEYLYENGAVI